MYNIDDSLIDAIFSCIEEGQKHNYSEWIIRDDVANIISNYIDSECKFCFYKENYFGDNDDDED